MSPQLAKFNTMRLPRTANLVPLLAASVSSLMMGGTAAAQTLPHPIVLGAPAHVAGTGSDLTTDFSMPAATEHSMHLLVGHSVFVNTKHRLSRVYVTNPAVLDSYTANPNQIVVTAKASGISTLILWDEQGDSQVYMISSDADVDNLRTALQTAMPKDSVDVKAQEGRVTLTGTVGSQAIADNAVKIAGLYSKEVSNAIVVNSAKIQQVRLKVRFVEVDRSKGSQFGLNFFSAGGNTGFATTTSQFAPPSLNSTVNLTGGGSSNQLTVSDPLNFTIYNSNLNIGATLKDLENKQLLQILAEPNITAMSGQKANFLAGGEFPFPIVQGGGAGSTVAISIQFRPYGVKLEFTPTVNPDGTIDLNIAPEVSALDYTNSVTISGYTIPALSTRRAQTEVVLRNGQSFALTGLLDRRTTDSFAKTPGIANVPILGQLFRSKSLSHSLSELVVIVTPEIVDPLTMHEAVAEPRMVVPDLDKPVFDKSIAKKETKFNDQQPAKQ